MHSHCVRLIITCKQGTTEGSLFISLKFNFQCALCEKKKRYFIAVSNCLHPVFQVIQGRTCCGGH